MVVDEAFEHAIADAHFWQAPNLRAEKELATGQILDGQSGAECRAKAKAIIKRLRAELTANQ
jgi:hypothetical protein